MLDYVADYTVIIGLLLTGLTFLIAVVALVVQVIIHRSRLSEYFGESAGLSRGRWWSYGTMLVLAGMISAGLLCVYLSSGGEDGTGTDVGAPAEPEQPESDPNAEVEPPEQTTSISIVVDVRDYSFIPGRDDIDLLFANESSSSILLTEQATLRVGRTYCPVELQGDLQIGPGDTTEVVVDGSRRIVGEAVPIGVDQQCELRYDVRRFGFDEAPETRLFTFTCVRAGEGAISGDNLCF